MATELERLTHFMHPFYQSTADASILSWYIAEYEYADVGASILWSTIPLNYDVKKFNTGASSTEYQSMSDILKVCTMKVALFEGMVKQRDINGSTIAMVLKGTVAGGATI